MSNFWKNLPKPFLALAPLDNVTDVVFREIVAKTVPPDVFFTEFTSADGLFSPGRETTIDKFKFTENQRPCIAQIWGRDTKNIYKAAKLIKELGFDGVDINMGGPAKDVMKKGCGGAMIMDFEATKEVIQATKEGAPNLALSIKTRLGQREIMTQEWISFLLKQNLDALTIHGRTAAQLSKGLANWEEIGKAVKLREEIAPDTIILGNGDIESYAQAIEMHEKYGVDGVMIGRGIFANPWIFEKTVEAKDRSKDEYIAILVKHLDLYKSTWPDERKFAFMKKFFKMYVKGFNGANELRQKLMECDNSVQAKQLIANNPSTLQIYPPLIKLPHGC